MRIATLLALLATWIAAVNIALVDRFVPELGLSQLGVDVGTADWAAMCLVFALAYALVWLWAFRRRMVPGPLYLAGESGHKRTYDVEAYTPHRRRGHRRL